ncbi:MAG: hypothetical protein V2A78_13175, partial [bacterium]
TVKYPSSAFEITSYLRISLLDMVTILSLMVTFSQNSYRVTISQNNNTKCKNRCMLAVKVL